MVRRRKKSVPPEAVAASPIHHNYHPAGHWNITLARFEEQLFVADFASLSGRDVGFSDIAHRLAADRSAQATLWEPVAPRVTSLSITVEVSSHPSHGIQKILRYKLRR
jgi:hypothetical protein